MYLQLPSILEAVPPSAIWEHAMPWWQGLTCRGQQWTVKLSVARLCTSFPKVSLCTWFMKNGFEEPCRADSPATSFPSIPLCQGTRISWILLCSASFTKDWWQSEDNLELSGSYQRPSWLPECQEEYRCSYVCNSFLYSPFCKLFWHMF
jgi:hypothetical protein